MKKLLLLSAAILNITWGFAQITINRSDFAYAGDWFRTATDTLPTATNSALLKTGGSNKNWDITGWVHQHTKDTIFYANGATYPGAPAGCNIVSFTRDPITKDSTPDFMIVSNSAVKVIFSPGDLGPTQGQLKVVQFPSTMGTNFKDSMSSYETMLATDLGIPANPLFDSVRIYFSIRVSSLIDGFGKLKTYAGNFDVIRQKLTNNVQISFKIRNKITGTYGDLPSGTVDNMNETMVMYNWLGANIGEPLLRASEDTLGNIISMDFILSSSRGLSSGFAEHKVAIETKAYPNPASDMLTIETQVKQNTSAQITVYDILGNSVLPAIEVNFGSGLNPLPIDISQLKPGVYFYSIKGNGINQSNRFMVK